MAWDCSNACGILPPGGRGCKILGAVRGCRGAAGRIRRSRSWRLASIAAESACYRSQADSADREQCD